jgi:putative transcriptional regulator
MKSLQGQFLVASPRQQDPNFAKTVILLVQHDRKGGFGVAVNSPASNTGRVPWERVIRQRLDGHRQLNLGGPVSGPLMALHANRFFGTIEVLPELFFTAKDQDLADLLQQRSHPCKVFVGYAGWGPEQIERELERGAWLIAPATARQVLSDRDGLWEKLLKHIGDSILQSMLSIHHIPENPWMN